MHERGYNPERERQVIGKNGVPVEIRSNPQSERRADVISLNVGGSALLETVQAESLRNEETLRARLSNLQDARNQAIIDLIHRNHPDAPSTIHAYHTFDQELENIYDQAVATLHEESPEIFAEMREIEERIKENARSRYEFGDKNPSTADIHVGKEGTLVYSRVSPDRVIRELTYAQQAIEQDPTKAVQIRAQQPDAETQHWIDELKEKLAGFDVIADIHQVEVLPAYQGKGIAAGLLDVARWDIEETRGLPFSVARVSVENPDGEKMLKLFEKAGYKKVFCYGYAMNREPNYYLVMRENTSRPPAAL